MSTPAYIEPDDDITTIIISEQQTDPDVVVSDIGVPGPTGAQGEQGPPGPKGDDGIAALDTQAPLVYEADTNTLSIDQTVFDPAGAAANALAQAKTFATQQKNARAFTYQQQSASQTWTIVHNLGTRPAVVIVDTANQEIFGDIIYSDNNSVVVQFTSAFSGTAYLI